MRLPKRELRRLVELIDLSCDGELNECSLDQRCQRGTAVLRQRARFAAHKESVGLEKSFPNCAE